MIRIDIDQNTIFWPALYLPTSGSLSSWPVSTSRSRAIQVPSSRLPQVGAPEAHEQSEEAEEQDHADPRMDRARRLSAAEQAGQEEQARMEQRQPGEREEHQARRRDPVIDPRAAGVAVDRDRIAGMNLVARLDVIALIMLRPSASLLGVLLVFSRDPVGASHDVMQEADRGKGRRSPPGPAYLVTPFHSSTIGLIRGSFGRSA